MATLKEALQYASQNPDSDFARQLTQHIKTGAADAEAKSLGIDLTPVKQYNPTPITQIPQPEEKKGLLSKTWGVVKGIGNTFTSAEQALGKDIAAGIGGNLYAKDISENAQKLADSDLAYVKVLRENRDKAIKEGKDPSHYTNLLANFKTSTGQTMSDIFPELNKSNTQVVGDAAGVLMDVLTAGTYKGVGTTGKLLTTAEKTAQATKAAQEAKALTNFATGVEVATKYGTKPLTGVVEKGLLETTKDIAKKTALTSAKGAGIGYGYDVATNLQEGKTGTEAFKPGFGTLLGGALPVVGGVYKASSAVTKELAPRIIGSLVKPSLANFAYGARPDKVITEMGITGNNLKDFGNNVYKARDLVGNELSNIYSNSKNKDLLFDVTDQIAKIDDEIAKQAKGGKNNQNIVNTLQNIKDALLYEHGTDATGNIVKQSNLPKNLSSMYTEDVFKLKQDIANQTRFTGNPSDDKTVNAILKDIYGGIKEKLNTAIEKNNPEIRKLNEQYAGLTSAELAINNREKIVQRQNLISTPVKVGGSAAVITAISTGGAAIPVILAGVGAGALDKALGSTAVKTRLAKWMSGQKPSTVAKILEKNPAIKTVLFRTYPKLSSQLNIND